MGDSLKNSFKKGLSTLTVLSLLNNERMYGYELVQTMSAYSDGDFTMRETALYPVLYRLEEQGYITSQQEIAGKRLRVYYSITVQGQQYLAKIRREYEEINAGVQRLLQKTEEERANGKCFIPVLPECEKASTCDRQEEESVSPLAAFQGRPMLAGI